MVHLPLIENLGFFLNFRATHLELFNFEKVKANCF